MLRRVTVADTLAPRVPPTCSTQLYLLYRLPAEGVIPLLHIDTQRHLIDINVAHPIKTHLKLRGRQLRGQLLIYDDHVVKHHEVVKELYRGKLLLSGSHHEPLSNCCL